MTKMSLRAIWWSITFLYIAFIYATLGVMPMIWDKINTILAGKSVAVVYTIYSIVGTLIFIYISFIKKERSLLKYVSFFCL